MVNSQLRDGPMIMMSARKLAAFKDGAQGEERH
jgi:hypothetical protein